jgi:hypothetical protein
VVADNAWVGGALVVVVVVVGGLVDVVVVLVLTCRVGAALRLKGPQASTLIFMARREKQTLAQQSDTREHSTRRESVSYAQNAQK